jgi:hypothetical protein
MQNVERILRCGSALAKRQEINGVKQVGFTLTVTANKAIDLIGKVQFGLRNVFVVNYRKVVQYHNSICKFIHFILKMRG